MTNAPIALRIHDGGKPLPEDVEPLVVAWLRANRINPGQVSIDHPISLLTVPAVGGDFLMQVIVFHQYYIGPDGSRELDFLTCDAVSFQRTVPMSVAFPQTAQDQTEAPAEHPAQEEQRPPDDDDQTGAEEGK